MAKAQWEICSHIAEWHKAARASKDCPRSACLLSPFSKWILKLPESHCFTRFHMPTVQVNLQQSHPYNKTNATAKWLIQQNFLPSATLWRRFSTQRWMSATFWILRPQTSHVQKQQDVRREKFVNLLNEDVGHPGFKLTWQVLGESFLPCTKNKKKYNIEALSCKDWQTSRNFVRRSHHSQRGLENLMDMTLTVWISNDAVKPKLTIWGGC